MWTIMLHSLRLIVAIFFFSFMERRCVYSSRTDVLYMSGFSWACPLLCGFLSSPVSDHLIRSLVKEAPNRGASLDHWVGSLFIEWNCSPCLSCVFLGYSYSVFLPVCNVCCRDPCKAIHGPGLKSSLRRSFVLKFHLRPLFSPPVGMILCF